MKRFGWVIAVVLCLAIGVPAAPAWAEDLEQNTSDQLEANAVLDEQPLDQSLVAASDTDAVNEGPAGEGTPEQLVVDDGEASENESVTDDVSGDAGNEAETGGDDSAPMSTQEDDPLPEIMNTEEPSEGAPGEGEHAPSENTVYSITSAKSTSVVVAVANNGASSGTNVELSASNSRLGNYWRLVSRADGLWSIINLRANMALAVNGTPASRANVTVVSGEGTGWQLLDNGDGTFSFSPSGYDKLVLDIADGKATAGTNVRLYTSNGSPAQRFTLDVINTLTDALIHGEKLDEGVVTIASALGDEKVIDIAGGSKANGGNVQLSSSNGSFAQKLFLIDAGNGLYALQSCVSGKFFDAQGGGVASGTNVQQYTGNYSLAQLWYLVKTSDGLWSFRNAKSGLALSVIGDSPVTGANVAIEDVSDEARQSFSIGYVNLFGKGYVLRLSPSTSTSLNVSASGSQAVLSQKGSTADGWWKVDTTNGNKLTLASLIGGKKLTVGGSVVSGASVTISTGAGTTWVILVNDGGSLTLSPKDNLRLALDVKGGKIAKGTAMQVYARNGSNAQRFITTNHVTLTKAAEGALTGESHAGIYTVKSALDSKPALDVKDGSLDSGANVQIYRANGTDAQKWELCYADSGLYRIRSIKSRLYLGESGATSGSNAAQYKSSSNLSQYWYVEKNSDGVFEIRNAASGLALDVQGGKNTNGTNVQLYKANGSKAQKWDLVETGIINNGTYAFSSDLTVYGMLVLDVKDGSVTSGANVQVYQSNGSVAQKWVLTYKGSGVYTIASKKSGLLLTVDGSSRANGGNVVQKANENSDFQRWTISLDNSGSYVFKNVGSGKVLDVKGGKSDNGVNVQQYSANGTKAQGWHIKTNHNPIPSGKLGKLVSRMIYYTDIVNVGYDQLTPDRWNIKNGGECDCSSLVINCLREAGFKTGDVSLHIGKVNAGEPHAGCTYTGNMSYYLTKNGWTRLSFSLSKLKPGDILLNDAYHTCVVISGSGSTALIAQASIDENYYGWGGKAGDQTGYETNIKQAYVYGHGGWDCILRYNG